jgi:hypothetical protein
MPPNPGERRSDRDDHTPIDDENAVTVTPFESDVSDPDGTELFRRDRAAVMPARTELAGPDMRDTAGEREAIERLGRWRSGGWPQYIGIV